MIERDGDRLFVRGSVTLADVLQWREAGIKAIDRDALTFDLGGIDEADSSALSLLMEWQRHAKSMGYRISFANMPENMRGLADVYGVLGLLPLSDAPPSAPA